MEMPNTIKIVVHKNNIGGDTYDICGCTHSNYGNWVFGDRFSLG